MKLSRAKPLKSFSYFSALFLTPLEMDPKKRLASAVHSEHSCRHHYPIRCERALAMAAPIISLS